MNIPGGIDCPGAELVYRVHDLVRSPETLVVVNCAGRTRSIIGAQSLINAGIPNRVVALKNGTMGWHLAGLTLEHGQSRHAPAPSAAALAKARAAAARVAERCGIAAIEPARLEEFRREADRTLYLFDVRTPEEYEAGHLPGARSAPGGQLVQATDAYVGTRGARLVLVDGESVRAPMTASWLRQMGWDEVYVIEQEAAGAATVAGAEERHVLGLAEADAATIGAAELKAALDRGEAVVADLGTSHGYREAHIPGAWFAIRSRLAGSLGKLPPAPLLVLASPDGVLARLAAAEAAAITGREVRVLEGGTDAWRAAGLPVTDADLRWADEPEDAWYKPYDRGGGGERAMKEYLDWEVDLVAQVERDGDARFRIVPMR
jgi:rhodanese-related sulfurtransferase